MLKLVTVSKRLFAFVMALPLLLTGCSVEVNLDTLLTPPKLSAQQEQIYQALQDTTGSEIQLKYPKRGNYLSAFIVADIDGDTGEEAIVFYEKSGLPSQDAGLRINVLDCINGEWLSICDRSAEGSEIEKVVLSPLGGNDRMNVIVGYSTANQSEKYISVYSYSDGYLDQTFSHSYALFDVAETGSGESNPDLILLGAATSPEFSAYAAVYRLAEDGRYHEFKYNFRDSYTDYSQLIYGTLSDGKVAIYVDAATGTSSLQTEILCMESTQLSNLLERCSHVAGDTVRRAGLACMDIDGDQIPEVPVQNVFLGYENADESEQIRQTRWLMLKEPRFYTEHYSYYSANNGYVFILPEEWENHVTAVNDTTAGELRFVAYNGTWEDQMQILLRVYIAYDEADLNEHLSAGYHLIRTKGTANYLVKSESGQELSQNIGNIIPCFRFLD
ncbi:MAG: hypothetical protein V3G42_11190 [Oscillospiraceae bacterium]